ncbi:MAG: hypothetical protein JWO08_3093 [Verrucomicrobiaceae bacterium]|nr:hypothetical protein [Verrucomicrobiaceae bacterium]
MPAPKKRTKRYVSRPPADVKLKAQPWKVAAVFNPIVAIVDQLEQTETIDVVGADQAVFRDLEGELYDSAAALEGVVEAYAMHEVRSGRCLGLDPLRQFANKLKYAMPIFPADTKAVRECLGRMKAETLEMTAGYARDLIQTYQIKEAIEGRVAQ